MECGCSGFVRGGRIGGRRSGGPPLEARRLGGQRGGRRVPLETRQRAGRIGGRRTGGPPMEARRRGGLSVRCCSGMLPTKRTFTCTKGVRTGQGELLSRFSIHSRVTPLAFEVCQ